jgi:hypothetical protein
LRTARKLFKRSGTILRGEREYIGPKWFKRLALTAESYGCRYKIERMFKCLKRNDFELESLYLKQAFKVNMMMAALVLAYTPSVVESLKKYKRRITLKKHGSLQISVFRYGLIVWQNHLRSFPLFIHKLKTYFDDWITASLYQLKLNVP